MSTATDFAARYVPVAHLQGDAKVIRFDFFRTVDDEQVARDMSAFSFGAQVRARPGGSALLAELEVDESNRGDGIVVFELSVPDATGLQVGQHHWDAQWVYLGRPFTFALGPWTTAGQVTR